MRNEFCLTLGIPYPVKSAVTKPVVILRKMSVNPSSQSAGKVDGAAMERAPAEFSIAWDAICADPTTNDAMMDCSVEEEPSLLDTLFLDRRDGAPLPDAKKQKCERDRWFVVDAYGAIKFVDREDEDDNLSLDGSSSVFGDDEGDSPGCSDTEATAAPSKGPGHNRQWSQTSADDITFFEQASQFQDVESVVQRETAKASRPSLSLSPNCTSASNISPRSELLQEGSPAYVRNTKIPVCGWFKSCRYEVQ